ncbi:MAG: CRISPR-associated endonuclease Cas2 [Succinivibrio sp.]|nr:CRISPR-associated endonuclease Cas2 [Succinivibrio sp.]
MLRVLICYDIHDNSVRGRAFRLLKKNAQRAQKSVFIFEGTDTKLKDLESRLSQMIEDGDSLMVVPCCDSCFARARMYGGSEELCLVA